MDRLTLRGPWKFRPRIRKSKSILKPLYKKYPSYNPHSRYKYYLDPKNTETSAADVSVGVSPRLAASSCPGTDPPLGLTKGPPTLLLRPPCLDKSGEKQGAACLRGRLALESQQPIIGGYLSFDVGLLGA